MLGLGCSLLVLVLMCVYIYWLNSAGCKGATFFGMLVPPGIGLLSIATVWLAYGQSWQYAMTWRLTVLWTVLLVLATIVTFVVDMLCFICGEDDNNL